MIAQTGTCAAVVAGDGRSALASDSAWSLSREVLSVEAITIQLMAESEKGPMFRLRLREA